jgi:hypothetical protein
MQIEAQVMPGVPNFSDGSPGPLSRGKQGELLVNEVNGRFAELTRRGALFHSVTGSVTVASALLSPLAASTGQPILGLLNPANSGRNLIIVKAGIVTVSGTPGGPMLWNFTTAAAAITATANISPLPGMLSNASTSVAKGYSATALTGLAAAMSVLKHASKTPAIAAAFIDGKALDDVDGDIVVPPGSMIALAAFAAGTSHVLQASISHIELPV